MATKMAREKALWEMKKDGKGKDGHGGSHGDSDDDKSHGTGPGPGNGGNGAANAGNVSRDPKHTTRSAVDKVKGESTNQRAASGFAPSRSGPCNTTASVREKGDGVALMQTPILPKVPSSSKSAPRVPPSPFDQQQTVELNIMAAYAQQNQPTNMQIYEELQAEEKPKLAELERNQGTPSETLG
jgi:hypothetical protein